MARQQARSLRELLTRIVDDDLSAPLIVYLLGFFGVLLLAHLLAEGG
jgi:hypothetical protein